MSSSRAAGIMGNPRTNGVARCLPPSLDLFSMAPASPVLPLLDLVKKKGSIPKKLNNRGLLGHDPAYFSLSFHTHFEWPLSAKVRATCVTEYKSNREKVTRAPSHARLISSLLVPTHTQGKERKTQLPWPMAWEGKVGAKAKSLWDSVTQFTIGKRTALDERNSKSFSSFETLWLNEVT